MKTLADAWLTLLGQGVTTIAMCFQLTRTDGEVFRFTTHDVDILVGGETFQAAAGMVQTTLKQEGNMSVDNMEISGFFDANFVTAADIFAGRWDYAEVEVYLVDSATYGVTEIS